MIDGMEEVEYVDECPTCGTKFVGMSPDEYRETHATEDCPKAPLPQLFVFNLPEERPSYEEDNRE